MAYTKTTDFLAKDSLLTGNPAKKVKGSEIDAEFDAIEAMLSSETGSGAVVLATSPTVYMPYFPDGGGSVVSTIAGYQSATGSFAAFSGCTAYGNKAFNALTGAGMTFQGTAVGYQALQNCLEAGTGNTAVGSAAGAACTSGTNNTFIGGSAGSTLTTGSNNTLIGRSAAPSAITVSNEITLGDSSIATLRCQVTSITSLSDARDKTDVDPLPSGLGTVMSLKPVRFTWNMRDGGKVGMKDAGFIAQDLQEVDDEYLRLVYSENPEKLEASYGRLIPVLVKALQELKAEVDELKAKV